MRGADTKQSSMLCLMSPESMVPAKHPLRRVKRLADGVLAELSPSFDAMYSAIGRPSIPPERMLKATLLMAFAVLSLLLAMVGLFGVLSFMVAQRTTEIGVRIALGASRERIMQQMLGDGLRPAIYGLVLGLVASVGVTRLIESLLFGTKPLDLAVFVVVSVTLLVVAALACALPAWRASR